MALPPRGSGRPVSRATTGRGRAALMQAVVAVGELAFVDDEAGIELARDDLRE